MEATQNTHAYIDTIYNNLVLPRDLSELSKKISSPLTGIGTDGLVVMSPSRVADVKMDIYNSDGSVAETCGNALRCVSKYVFEKQIVKTEEFFIETLAGVVKATIQSNEDLITIDMGKPKIINQKANLIIDEKEIIFTEVSMGNPHAVIFVENVDKTSVRESGPKIENNEYFSKGTNVEFIELIPNKEIKFRVWERGVGETMACGTGACASVVSLVINGFVKQGEEVSVNMPGGTLKVSWSENDHVYMTGSAKFICEGSYLFSPSAS